MTDAENMTGIILMLHECDKAVRRSEKREERRAKRQTDTEYALGHASRPLVALYGISMRLHHQVNASSSWPRIFSVRSVQ